MHRAPLLLILLFHRSSANIWDNLYSNEYDSTETMKDSTRNFRAKDSFFFGDLLISASFVPSSNRFGLHVTRRDKITFWILVDLKSMSLSYQFSQSQCRRIPLSEIFRFDLNNLNSLFSFLFFKETEEKFLLDASFLGYPDLSPKISLNYKNSSIHSIAIKLIFAELELVHEENSKGPDLSTQKIGFEDCLESPDPLEGLRSIYDEFAGELIKTVAQKLGLSDYLPK